MSWVLRASSIQQVSLNLTQLLLRDPQRQADKWVAKHILFFFFFSALCLTEEH